MNYLLQLLYELKIIKINMNIKIGTHGDTIHEYTYYNEMEAEGRYSKTVTWKASR